MINTTLYIVRHGETEANKTGVLMGSTDTPLNDRGRAQAAELHQRTQDLAVDLICASPLCRTMETGSIVFGEAAEIIPHANLQEFHFGDWEGMHFKEISKQYPDIWEMWLTDWEQTQIPGAESFAGFKQRVIAMVEELLRTHAGKRLAIVSHGGCIRTLLAHFFSESVSKGYWQFKVDNATLTEIEFMGELPILTRFNYR